MELRYRTAVVTAAGGRVGRELAVTLGRRGMSVLAADRDLAAAEETAALVRRSRVVAWALQADPADPVDAGLLIGRSRDLGGADVLVDVHGGAPRHPALAGAVRTPAASHLIGVGPPPRCTESDVCATAVALLDAAESYVIVEVVLDGS